MDLPTITQPRKIAIFIQYREQEYARLKLGFKPIQMEDRWSIVFIDRWLYFLRSWTGHCIYRAELRTEDNDYFIQSFDVECDTDKYKVNSEDVECEIFKLLIDRGLLEKDISASLEILNNTLNPLQNWRLFGSFLLPPGTSFHMV